MRIFNLTALFVAGLVTIGIADGSKSQAHSRFNAGSIDGSGSRAFHSSNAGSTDGSGSKSQHYGNVGSIDGSGSKSQHYGNVGSIDGSDIGSHSLDGSAFGAWIDVPQDGSGSASGRFREIKTPQSCADPAMTTLESTSGSGSLSGWKQQLRRDGGSKQNGSYDGQTPEVGRP